MPRTLSENEISAFRNKLCETAEHLFAEYGIDGFTMRRLASALGVSAMTPYRYYRNKSELLTAVRTHAFLQLAGTLQDIQNQPGDGPTPSTDMLCHAYLIFAREHSDPYKLMFSEPEDGTDTPKSLKQAYRQCLDSFSLALKSDLEATGATLSPEKMAFAYWSMLHGAIVISQMLDQEKISELEDLVLRASHSFLHGCHHSHESVTAATQSRRDRIRQLKEDPETV